ncbi:MAG TPA: hypothetical protein PK079_01155 [Leptospiraceae bacterium]|nr:hypothetical protein [Leptospiraceae bacterium]HMW03879.1 hypothetical protein [Leptospiraceae bacterium]HMX32407.1 hypothetical protein [Leptospiraceae bacterium]HMY29859.1 hypothetical protein [Leptospiraceae bacterium]HMZ62997.1 hypothetical protein [Leptospiraceae bacterium]
MIFFGRIVLFLLFTGSLFANPKIALNKGTILKGEPLELSIEIGGSDPEVSLSKNVFSENGVTAEYIGLEDNTTIINSKITNKKIVKFRILTAKTGNLTTPKIILSINQQPFTAESIAFTVKPEKYTPRPKPMDSIFDQFFSGNFPGFQERAYANPNEDDIKIGFYTSRSRVYIGETVIGSFTLYYKNLERPNFERNEQDPLEFPFFTTELLPNVSINLPANASLDGVQYKIVPYNREIYALTPLRKGKYQLGGAKFSIEGNPLSYFSPMVKDSFKKSVEVLDIPNPRPTNFSGEVGDYQIKLAFTAKEAAVGVPIPFSIQINGQGTGAMFKDPLQNFCPQKKCKADITFLDENKVKKFTKLKTGEYGFESDSTFRYSLFPKEEGILNLGSVEVVFFNPNTESYETISFSFPEIRVKPAPIFTPKEIPTVSSVNFQLWGFYFVVTGLGLFAIYLLRTEILASAKKIFHRIPLDKFRTSPEIHLMDKAIGNKKGALLKVFLQEKGLNKAKVEELVRIKSKAGNAKFSEIYSQSDARQKEIILNLIKDILKENKLI